MFFKQLAAKESTLSYFLGCGSRGKAVAVDVVAGDEQWFIDQAKEAKVTITHVIDTHVHADHYSGGRRLAQLAGAHYCLHESDAEFVWVSGEFLKREAVEEWSEMPLYLAESNEEAQGFLSANIDKALAKGLKFRPLRETIRETLDWRKTKTDELKAGISAEREAELLRKWREQQ